MSHEGQHVGTVEIGLDLGASFFDALVAGTGTQVEFYTLPDMAIEGFSAEEVLARGTSGTVAGDSLRAIAEKVAEMSAHVSEISSAAGEQARGIEEIHAVILDIEQTIQHHAAMSEETTAGNTTLIERPIISTSWWIDSLSRQRRGIGACRAGWPDLPPHHGPVCLP